ncbi:MFS transporter [Purpureocillium lilacinum]|uniref:MFS transporter n=1 Tax=Purpureocillium lilacinum TaxID=33203 RepID=A0A179HP77_PURLI|nr:MFS transporter [Purpureocillium lilacinum]OAQ91351.1 MFS transporter [Purpureocillium lilacinum]
MPPSSPPASSSASKHHAHARSFSNDYSAGQAPEARRHRRGRTLNLTAREMNPQQLLGQAVSPGGTLTLTTTTMAGPSSRLSDTASPASLRPTPDPESRPSTPTSQLSVLKPAAAGPVSWSSLPRKDQLAILFLARLVDFLQVASLQAYVFYQLKALDPSGNASDARISQQAGILQGCFTGAQVATAMLWGKAADAGWCGRKRVLVIGLAGTALSCLGYGFATTFFWAAFWRAFGGAVNGTVGIIRTMVAEITKEKRYQSRAFLILPMSFNVAGIFGPILGGVLADPMKTMPGLFGEGAVFGFQWIHSYPYALPSLVNFVFLTICTAIVFLFLEETSKERRGKFDYGLHLGDRVKQVAFGIKPTNNGYTHLSAEGEDIPLNPVHEPAVKAQRLPFRRLWTRNVVFTLITGAFYDFHLGAFGNIWSLFLSTPRYATPEATERRRDLPLLFTGGLGMPASTVGFATSFLGILGMLLQVTLYPPIQARLGTIRSFRYFLFLFPVAYFVAPYLSILPSSTAPPEPAGGGFIWIGIILVLLLQVTARTFTLPASIILLNNCSPHPSVLGTIHGLGQSVSAGFRTVGPVVGGWWYGYGLDIGMVAWGWWGVAAMSALACASAMGMYEGSGHEVFLDGEEEE